MAKAEKRIRIELTRQEKEFLDNFLSSLYDIVNDDDEQVGNIFTDIYNSYSPHGDEKSSTWTGDYADIIITE